MEPKRQIMAINGRVELKKFLEETIKTGRYGDSIYSEFVQDAFCDGNIFHSWDDWHRHLTACGACDEAFEAAHAVFKDWKSEKGE